MNISIGINTPEVMKFLMYEYSTLKFGGYNEEIFVDGADFNFSKRLRSCGYTICRLNKILVKQPFGEENRYQSKYIVKLLNLISHLSSLVALRMNYVNVLRKTYPVYNLSRRKDFYRQKVNSSSGFKSLFSLLYVAITSLLDIIASSTSRNGGI